jgi:hypothetical protein
MQRAKHAATAFLFLMVGLFANSPARAASRDAKERMARTACLDGDYKKGVAILSQLFVDTKISTFIYNQGRCFEQNARYQEAISRFQEYLRVDKKLSEEDKAETQKHISDCQASMQASSAGQSAQPVVAAPAVQAPPANVAPPPIVPVSVVGERAVPSDSSPAPGAGLRTAGVITAAVGGAALVAGIILNLKVNSMASDFQTLNGYTDSKESDRKTYATLAWVSYGVGAACVATGSVLYILGLQGAKQGSTSVTLLPAFGPGGAAAVLKGSF